MFTKSPNRLTRLFEWSNKNLVSIDSFIRILSE